jgi:hypothetical protein
MEIKDIKITKEELKSEMWHLKPVSENSHLIIKSNLDLQDETFLNFKSVNGKEVKNILNRNGLNKRISIPDWVGSIYIEATNTVSDLSFSICVEY